MRIRLSTHWQFAPPGRRNVGPSLQLPEKISRYRPSYQYFMPGSDSCFSAVATFCENVILQKEATKKAQKDDLHSERIPFRVAANGRDEFSPSSASVASREEVRAHVPYIP